MKISKALAEDLRYLSAQLEWSEEDKEEVRTSIRADFQFFNHFWSVFARAHRAGYRFCQATGFEKLDVFCERNGIPDPYYGMYSGKEIDEGARK